MINFYRKILWFYYWQKKHLTALSEKHNEPRWKIWLVRKLSMVTIFSANCRKALFILVSVGANSFFAFCCYTVCSFTKSRIETYFDSFFVEMCLVQTCFKFYFVSDTNKEGWCNNSSSLLLVSDGRIIQYSTAGSSF